MDKLKPIKRSKELISLSRDHHDGLLLCWKIKEGIRKEIEITRIVNYVIHFYSVALADHFNIEEQLLFTLLDKDNDLRLRAEHEHVDLRILLNKLKERKVDTERILNDFCKLLEAHIRFEERELFPFIEKYSDGGSLAEASDKINQHPNKKEIGWDDPFWIKN